jgi:hypothetical protein
MLAAMLSSIPVSLFQLGMEKNNDGELLSLPFAGDINSYARSIFAVKSME